MGLRRLASGPLRPPPLLRPAPAGGHTGARAVNAGVVSGQRFAGGGANALRHRLRFPLMRGRDAGCRHADRLTSCDVVRRADGFNRRQRIGSGVGRRLCETQCLWWSDLGGKMPPHALAACPFPPFSPVPISGVGHHRAAPARAARARQAGPLLRAGFARGGMLDRARLRNRLGSECRAAQSGCALLAVRIA